MALVLRNVSYAYPGAGRNAVENCSFEFLPGRFYGIFGSNGSGKSTLLKLLAGDIPCNNVTIDGNLLKKLSPRQKATLLAVAEQENELILPFTVRECIKLGCYIRNNGDDELVTRLLTQWQMLDWQDKRFAELSGGERQRVKLLRVLAQDTPYILLDEPASSLDWARQLDLYGKMRSLAHESGKCVIMICHDLYMAPAFIDEMLLMKSGSLIYSGKPDSADANLAVSQAFERDIALTRSSNSVTVSW